MRFDRKTEEIHVILDRETSRLACGPKKHSPEVVAEALRPFRRGLLQMMSIEGWQVGKIIPHSIHLEINEGGIVEELHLDDREEILGSLCIEELTALSSTADEAIVDGWKSDMRKAIKRMKGAVA